MMSKKKIGLIAISLVVCLGLVSYAIASYWIASNEVGVTITNFAITLGDPGGSYAPGETVTFTGRLVKTGVGGLDDHLVYIQYWDGSAYQTVAQGWTSGGGFFNIGYTIPDGWTPGTVYFLATVSVP